MLKIPVERLIVKLLIARFKLSGDTSKEKRMELKKPCEWDRNLLTKYKNKSNQVRETRITSDQRSLMANTVY